MTSFTTVSAKEISSPQNGSSLLLIIDLLSSLFSIPKATMPEDLSIATDNQVSVNIEPATSIKNLRELLNNIEEKVGTPKRILEGVFTIESPGLLNSLTDEQVRAYSQPGSQVLGCRVNSCSAAGPMQFTTGIDNQGSSTCSQCCSAGKCLSRCPNAWGGYGNSINKYGRYEHQSNVCNLRDNLYAAGAKLKNDSGNKGGDWTKEQVFSAARSYYGACDDNHRYPRLNNGKSPGRTYCEFVWWYYTAGQ